MVKEHGLLYELSVVKGFVAAVISSNIVWINCHYISVLIIEDMEPVTCLTSF